MAQTVVGHRAIAVPAHGVVGWPLWKVKFRRKKYAKNFVSIPTFWHFTLTPSLYPHSSDGRWTGASWGSEGSEGEKQALVFIITDELKMFRCSCAFSLLSRANIPSMISCNSSFGCNNLYQELENWRIYSPDNELIRFERRFLQSKNFSRILDNSVADSFK